jgi:hypothetical protein
MNLQENIQRIKAVMGLITEDSIENLDWLIDWFKKVPEEKLKRTFTTKDAKGKVWTLSRNEILKLLSDNSNIVVINDPNSMEIHDLDVMPATYSPPSNSTYPGKILISGNWKNLIKTTPVYKDTKDVMSAVIHHEKIHHLQYRQSAATQKSDYDTKLTANSKSQWSKKISGFCKLNTNTFCKKARSWDPTNYLKKPEEIYAHLFTIREYLGIQPMDIITNVIIDVQDKIKIANVSVSVSRGGKVIKLPTRNMDTASTTFEILYCCNNSFKETLMYLHNTLASIETSKQVDGDKLA